MKKIFSLLALLMMTMASWAEEQTPNYLTLTVNEGSATVRTMVHFAYDGEGTPDSYGVPSRDFPLIMFSINDGEWFSPQGEFQYLYQDELGYWAGYFKNEPQLKKGDVLRIKGNNETLASFAKGDVWLSFINCSEDFSLSHSGNASSLFDGGGYASKEPDINAFMGNAFDFMNIVGCVTNDGATTWYDDAASFMTAVNNTSSGEMSVKLLADCDLGNNGTNRLTFETTTTFDLNGYTLKGHVENDALVTINDSSEGKTGKVSAAFFALGVYANMTINGGTFEGDMGNMVQNANLTLNGGTFVVASNPDGVFDIRSSSYVIIAYGYEYTDGNDQTISGTLDSGSAPVTFSGSVVKTPIAEITRNGSTTRYADVDIFRAQLMLSREGDVSARLLADCDLGDDGRNSLIFNAPTTFDLNGYTLTGCLEINAPSTINDSSMGKTGKVTASGSVIAITADADVTVNGGTYYGVVAVQVNSGATVTLNGCTINVAERNVFMIFAGGKVVIPDGYEYTDGDRYSVNGTLTFSSALVEFAGSIVKATFAEVTIDGATFTYTDEDEFMQMVNDVTEGEMSIKLLADCNLGSEADDHLYFQTATTFDLNGHTLTGRVIVFAQTTITDSTVDGRGRVVANADHAIAAWKDMTISGGTFEGEYCIALHNDAKVTLTGGKYDYDGTAGPFYFNSKASQVVIANGYAYTNGGSRTVTGTITQEHNTATFIGSVVKTETPTAIDNIDAQNTQKTIKTIENGEIVIIKGGERFNLRGAKIK